MLCAMVEDLEELERSLAALVAPWVANAFVLWWDAHCGGHLATTGTSDILLLVDLR